MSGLRTARDTTAPPASRAGVLRGRRRAAPTRPRSARRRTGAATLLVRGAAATADERRGRAGGAPGRHRGARDPRRAVVRRAGRLPGRLPVAALPAARPGCTPTRRRAAREFDAGRPAHPVAEVVAGVVDPPGPTRSAAMVDDGAPRHGVAATSPTPCFRAAAFARVAAAGRGRASARRPTHRRSATVAADHAGRPARARRRSSSSRAARPDARISHAVQACTLGRAPGRGSPGSQHQAATSGHAP